ncbi:hypothetical protein H2O04_34095, partial [Pseudomonas aeruginosa]|nr:hypothetical protein [Pseudomonas aeruginosa]MBA5134441.1 hypothetical protein [Pseudomonas aeruginosa]
TIPAHRPQDHITLEMAPLEIRHRSVRPISAKHAQASRFLQQSPVSTSCTAWTFSVDQSIVEDWDGVLANNLPGTSIVNASQNRIRSTIGIPGSETANDAKLSRVAEQNVELNRMRTNLLLGNNDIKEVGRIEAVNAAISGLAEASQLRVNGVSQFNGEGTFQDGISLQKVVQENTSCPKTGAIARSSAGVILSCQSGII